MSIRASLLYYDIGTDIKFPNPSPILRRVGVRVNLSVWVVPNHLIPHNLLNRMDTKGVSRNVVEFSTAESDNLVKIAQAAFAAQAIAAANSAQKSATAAAEQADDDGLSEAEAAHYIAGRVRTATRKAEKLLADLINAADGFGLTPEDFAAPDAFGQLRIIRSVSVNRAATYAKATRKLRAIGTADGLANAADADSLPYYVAADALRESGDDDTADELQAAFEE